MAGLIQIVQIEGEIKKSIHISVQTRIHVPLSHNKGTLTSTSPHICLSGVIR